VSDPRKIDPDDPLYYAPPWPRGPNDDTDPTPLRRVSAQRKPDETIADSHPAGDLDTQAQKSDVFAEAVAKALLAQGRPDLVEMPATLRAHRSFGVAGSFALGAGVVALLALIFFALQPSQGPVGGDTSSALPTRQSLKSSSSLTPQPKSAPTLVVRDSSGAVNEPLSLGVSVNAAEPGATVRIDGMPATARLSFGRRMSASEWRVDAQEISNASIIPPTGFVGDLKLSAELLGSDGVALVGSSVRLTWIAAQAGSAIVPPPTAGVPPIAATAATVPSSPAPTTPEQRPVMAPPVAATATPPGAEPMQGLRPDEIADFIARAQELLTAGDPQSARLLLLRAAKARDARAALYLARTFDPIVLRQLGASDQRPDPAQARSWYQKAKEWGSPDAQRQLDALAGYSR
jgi:hypothetical protein